MKTFANGGNKVKRICGKCQKARHKSVSKFRGWRSERIMDTFIVNIRFLIMPYSTQGKLKEHSTFFGNRLILQLP